MTPQNENQITVKIVINDRASDVTRYITYERVRVEVTCNTSDEAIKIAEAIRSVF